MDASAALVKVLREEGPRVLATLVRQLGDLPVAEDALSEATIAALEAWPASGIPDNLRAWLTVVARRKALDLLRRESARAGKETAAYRWGTERAKDEMEEVIDAMETESQLRDDMLRFIFTCCHPALSREAQVALALRTLARSRWLQRAVSWSGGKAGPYQLQAYLAAAHSTATSWAETDWDRIIELYDLLGSVAANPVVALNRAHCDHGARRARARAGRTGGHRRAGAFPSLARRSGRQSPTAWPDGRGCRRAGNRRLVGAHRGRTTSASVPSPRREAGARLTYSRAAGVLYWFRRSSSHQTQIPISEITLERRSR